MNESQTRSNIVISGDSPGTIDIRWFGARGNDTIDDTEALRKAFDIAAGYISSVNVMIPNGKYLIFSLDNLINNNISCTGA